MTGAADTGLAAQRRPPREQAAEAVGHREQGHEHRLRAGPVAEGHHLRRKRITDSHPEGPVPSCAIAGSVRRMGKLKI